MAPHSIDVQKELLLLKKCEKNTHTGISAKGRFIEFLKIFQNIPEPQKILDVGGNFGTARWFKEKFPQAKVTILNNSQKELSSYSPVICQNAQNFLIFDFYFCCMEVSFQW